MREEVLRVSDQARPHALHDGAVAVMLMKHVRDSRPRRRPRDVCARLVRRIGGVKEVGFAGDLGWHVSARALIFPDALHECTLNCEHIEVVEPLLRRVQGVA